MDKGYVPVIYVQGNPYYMNFAVYKADEVDARIQELKEVIKDMLDAFWDMSPLQYAQSRGFQCMTDEVGEEIKRRARKLIATETLGEHEIRRMR